MRQRWIDYVMKMQRMLKKPRGDNDSVAMMVTWIGDDTGITTEMLGFQVQDIHKIGMTSYLIGSLCQSDHPETAKIFAKIKAQFDELLKVRESTVGKSQ